MYPYRKVEPLIPKKMCPYCYIVRHELSQTFWANYSIRAETTEGLKEGKFTKEQVRQEIVDSFVRKGWDKECTAFDDISFHPFQQPSAYIVVCPNCGIISRWQNTLEEAERRFVWACDSAIQQDFECKVEEITRRSDG